MADGATRTGGCLCGAVRYSAKAGVHMDVCHCAYCRRWSGGVFMAVPVEDVAIEDEAATGVYRSSEYGERVFCKTCGSSLFWRMQDRSMAVAALQSFDDLSGIAFAEEIFIDSKPDLYAFAGTARKLTGEEFFARVAAGQGSSQESSGG